MHRVKVERLGSPKSSILMSFHFDSTHIFHPVWKRNQHLDFVIVVMLRYISIRHTPIFLGSLLTLRAVHPLGEWAVEEEGDLNN